LYDSCTTLALRRPTQPSVGLTKSNAAPRPFDSMSYTNRKQIVVRTVLPVPIYMGGLGHHDDPLENHPNTLISRKLKSPNANGKFYLALDAPFAYLTA
jgi:hypothetical protein